MNRFNKSSLAIALIAMFEARSYPSPGRPARLYRSKEESERRMAAAKAKRERRQLRNLAELRSLSA